MFEFMMRSDVGYALVGLLMACGFATIYSMHRWMALVDEELSDLRRQGERIDEHSDKDSG